MKKKRQNHNYTSELELKSLLIRIKNKNKKEGKISIQLNNKINKYIKWFNLINGKKYNIDEIQRKNIIKNRIKQKIITLSETTQIDESSYENFGKIILLMISKILTKPNFSGYTYRDEMYSDAIHKILKYLHNFNHKMISERSGQLVNAFAYISQIIHNSVLYIINTKKKELENIKHQVSMEIVSHNLSVQDYNRYNQSRYYSDEELDKEVHEIVLNSLPNGLLSELNGINSKKQHIHVYIPDDYKISIEEYNEMRLKMKDNISIMRIKND
jgi:hypothetical protein